MRKHASFLLPSLVLAMHAGESFAQSGQPWLDDRRYGQGIGIRAGDLEIHPGVAAQLGYDSNYLQNSGDVGVINAGADTLEVNEPVVDVARLRVTPSISLKTLSESRDLGGEQAVPPAVNFNANASLSYNKLIALDSAIADDGLSDFFSGMAGLTLDILPERPWGADMNGSFTRMVQPNSDPSIPPAFNRDIMHGGAGVSFRPGGGLFSWRMGYDATYTLFENDAFSGYNNLAHSIEASGHWKFLPRTAFLYEGEIGFLDYTDPDSSLAEATPVSTKLGLSGLLSNHFSLMVMLGWMATFYEQRAGAAEDFDGPIGQAQLTWYPSPQPTMRPDSAAVGMSSLALGYSRSAENAYLGNFVQRDRIYADLSYFLAGTAILSLQGGVSMLSRPPSVLGDNPGPDDRTPAFTEYRADTTAFAEVRTSNTFGINLTLIYSSALSNQIIRAQPEATVAPGDPISADNLRFDRYEAWLGARWFM